MKFIIIIMLNMFMLQNLFGLELDFKKYCLNEKVCFDSSEKSLKLQKEFKLNFIKTFENMNQLNDIKISTIVPNNYIVKEYIKHNNIDIDVFNKNIMINDFLLKVKKDNKYIVAKIVFMMKVYEDILKNKNYKEYNLNDISKFNKEIEIKNLLSMDFKVVIETFFEKGFEGIDLNKYLNIDKFSESLLNNKNKMYNDIYLENKPNQYNINNAYIEIWFYSKMVKYFDIEYFKNKLSESLINYTLYNLYNFHYEVNIIVDELKMLENKIFHQEK